MCSREGLERQVSWESTVNGNLDYALYTTGVEGGLVNGIGHHVGICRSECSEIGLENFGSSFSSSTRGSSRTKRIRTFDTGKVIGGRHGESFADMQFRTIRPRVGLLRSPTGQVGGYGSTASQWCYFLYSQSQAPNFSEFCMNGKYQYRRVTNSSAEML